MKKVVIYVEGGGDAKSQRDELRMGFDSLFRTQKEAARKNGISLRFVPSGGRGEAYKNFCTAMDQSSSTQHLVLLVDSEEPIPAEIDTKDEASRKSDDEANAKARVQHLVNRDGWSFKGVEPSHVHLLVQCMEAWILADPEKIKEFYKKNFRENTLPRLPNLETEAKTSIYSKIAAATKDTQKGEYSEANNAKITHASKLLGMIRPDLISVRCPRFKTFVKWLDEVVSPSTSSNS